MNAQVNLSPAWQAMLQQPETHWDLCHAALLIAAQLQPEMNVEVYQHKIDAMIDEMRSRVRRDMDEQTRVEVLNDYFYNVLGFAGDKQDYYLPENSLMNQVIERRRGIPITLAVLYLKLAAAIDLDAYGIGFPGHYLVGVHAEHEDLVLDPFEQGHFLNHAQLRNMLQQLTHVHADDVLLEKNLLPASNGDSVVRMLRNLKQIYIDAQKVELALACIEMILSILPGSPDELRDRGMIYQHIEYTQGAINDLTQYLKLVPDAEERGVIEALLDSLQGQRKSLH
ncbi:MAG: tetratricopeptide repeat protein [Gammaproteobacteria bacterium]|nr:tetratricopeptide repeat protein [Gammaproteobacteria bacterium]